MSGTRLAVLALAVLAACETPPMRVRFRYASDGVQSCGTTSCADLALGCQAVLNVRILDPQDPSAPYLSPCEQIPMNGRRDLCAINGMSLGDVTLEVPKQTYEVQAMIWPLEAVQDPITKELDCRKFAVEFDAVAGLPVSQHPAPALGGRAFYHPGDEETVITLGCTDLSTLATCAPPPTLRVAATVEDFDNPGVSVSIPVGDQLHVHVGEPHARLVGSETVFALDPVDTRPLELKTAGSAPVWTAEVDFEPTDLACLQVQEDGSFTTTAVTCRPFEAPPMDGFDMLGYLLPKPTLERVLEALRLSTFPVRGLTIGIVLDASFNRAAGKAVTVVTPNGEPATVQYLSADLSTVGGAATSTSGIFVSEDAPFRTRFGIAGSPLPVLPVGGLIEDKVTIVFLQLPSGT